MADSTTKNPVKELTDKLEQGVKDIFASDMYAEYLKTMSRFHKYSTRNTLLIHMQNPKASLVAGFQSWQSKFQRHVVKGAKSIKIFAPVPFTKREEKEKLDPVTLKPVLDEHGMPVMESSERQIARFKVTSVFDVSQTEGKPLPSLVQDLTGNVEQYEAFMDALQEVSPLPIKMEPMADNQDGYCRFGEHIGIREGMSEIQTVCAVIHEITHAKLHDIDSIRQTDPDAQPKDRSTKEVEAESVSYAVCQHFGIETGANSFGYVAEWGKNRGLKELNASLDTIRKTAAELIDAIDGKFQELVKERNIVIAIGEQQTDMPEQEPAQTTASPQASAETEVKQDMERELYSKFAAMFPEFMNGDYNTLRLEAENAKPLVLEWVFGDTVSIAHTYELGGEPAYEPLVMLKVSDEAQTMTASSFELSEPPRRDVVHNGGRTDAEMQGNINRFTLQWLDRAAKQRFRPVEATVDIGADGKISHEGLVTDKTVTVTFGADGKPVMPEPEKQYDLGYGFLGNGITVWNRAEERDGDYVTVAHIAPDRSVTFYDKDMPHEVRQRIDTVANSPDTRAFGFSPAPENVPPHIDGTPTPASVYEAVKKVMPETAGAKNLDLSRPDPLTTNDMRNEYGYTDAGMLPMSTLRAAELFDADHCVYLLYPDNTEAMALDRAEILSHDGLCGIEAGDWERSPVYAAQMALAVSAEGKRESELLYGDGNRFGIYQIRDDIDDAHDYRFAPIKELEAYGLSVSRANYELVYTAPFPERIEFLSDRYPVLNRIYEDFNVRQPADYTARSVSVSDVILLKYNNNISTHYVDSKGFMELAGFLGEENQPSIIVDNPMNKRELPALSQVGTRQAEYTGASVAQLESDANSGKVISLSDLTNAIKAERSQGGTRNDAPKTKPTLMERLEAGKRMAATQGTPKPTPSHDTSKEGRE